MRTTLSCSALILATCVSASAQVVKVEPHAYASDIWGKYYNSGHSITFSGRVTGIEVTKSVSGGDNEVTLLVRNREGGGTSVVDVGPQWYVDHQTARIKLKDRVQVTGSKVLVDGRGIVLAKMIQVNGQGGLVVSLRRQNGRAYWLGTEVAQNNTAIPSGPNVLTGTITNFGTYNVGTEIYGDAILQTANGAMTIDLGPQWYLQRQDLVYNVGDNVSVVSGPGPVTIGPNGIYPSYAIYNGPSVYTLRNQAGNPVYNWEN